MKSQPLFMEDSYLQEMEAEILEVHAEGPHQWQVILSQTVFYPRGGGQSADQGVLESADWKGQVYQVLMKKGEIVHYVKGEKPVIHSRIKGKIDWNRRYQNMRLHSAGHVIDFALYLLEYSPKRLTPLKADHGKKPYIVYQGKVEEDLQNILEEKSNALIEQDLSFCTHFTSYEELEKTAIYLQPGLPQNKPLRMLTLDGVGSVADGGTQVRKTTEVGSVTITKIEQVDNETIVHYKVQN
jgi:Ser-tRNA(Ala) deacylase AlaX